MHSGADLDTAREIGALAQSSGRLAIDTEFMSERRYQAMLCLAQVAVPEGDRIRTALLDPLEGEGFDHRPLAAAVADPAVELVVHAGRQDVAIIRRTWETDVTNVFDTQVAAAFLGHGGQIGYAALVRRVLGHEPATGEGFTKWDRRPLTDKQKTYALADAEHLLELGDALEEQLIEKGRLAWAREECLPVEASSDERDPDEVFRRLGGVDKLRGGARGVARELVGWRDAAAREADRAPSSIVPDHALIELARRAPSTKNDLDAIRGLPQQTLHRRHRELLAAIERGRDREVPSRERAPKRDSREAPLVALCGALVRHRSLETGVASELIATQSELAAVVGAARSARDAPEARVLEGWRRELVGADLLDLLAGRLQLGVTGEGGLRVQRPG